MPVGKSYGGLLASTPRREIVEPSRVNQVGLAHPGGLYPDRNSRHRVVAHQLVDLLAELFKEWIDSLRWRLRLRVRLPLSDRNRGKGGCSDCAAHGGKTQKAQCLASRCA